MFFSRTLNTFLALTSVVSCHQYKHEHVHHKRSENSTTLPDYEFVIVGSGAGGSPLAARLALAGYSVLLIDAGEDHGDEAVIKVPSLHPYATAYEAISWNYFVSHYSDLEQQKRDSKMSYTKPDGEIYTGLYPPEGSTPLGILYPRTGALGGCSVHNAVICIKGHDRDWRYIQTITGDDSWDPENMLQYFVKLENCQYLPNTIYGHGFSGWLHTVTTNIELLLEDLKVVSLILAASTAWGPTSPFAGIVGKVISLAQSLGNALLTDLNNPFSTRDNTEGMYLTPLSISLAEYDRVGPREFVLQVANAKNPDGSKRYKLDLQLNTLVTKIAFDTTKDRPLATGVEFLVGKSLYSADPRFKTANTVGKPGSVHATREVILSAGTFNTPQLLKLSGIGPEDELSSFDIPIIKNLPGVGGNMQDRYEMGVVGQASTAFTLLQSCTFLEPTAEDDPCYLRWKYAPLPILKGAYTSNGIAIAYPRRSSVATDSVDLQLGGVTAYFKGYFPHYEINATADHETIATWTWLTLKAHSRNNMGTVTLRSTNPQDTPIINFNTFAKGGDEDIQAVYEGMRLGEQAFRDLLPLQGGFTQIWPEPGLSEDELKQFIRDETWGHHASCTCPISADDDPLGCLDSEFRVRGIDHLRVVDASAFPLIPGAYIACPLYILAEKAADVIITAAKASG